MFKQVKKRVEDTGTFSKQEIEYLTTPKRVEETTVSWGEYETNQTDAYRVLFNDDRGPGKGGIRYHKSVSVEEVKTLAFLMSLKTSLVNIPLGGAKGGVKVNTKKLTSEEIEQISRSYIENVYSVIGENKDIPAPDMYTGPKEMAWMLDEYENITGKHQKGVVTGKPLSLGGSKGRNKATSTGAYEVIKQFITEGTVAIQGYGNAGRQLAEILSEEGYRVVAVSDSSGAIHTESSLNIKEVSEVKREEGSVTKYSDAKKISNKELLELDVDLLVPAALENAITKENAKNVKAELIAEVANGPVTKEAEELLESKVIPDILCNSGGVIVSYFEWVQNRTGLYWSEKKVHQKLQEKLRDATQTLKEENKGETLRETAYRIAGKRICNAAKHRGRLQS